MAMTSSVGIIRSRTGLQRSLVALTVGQVALIVVQGFSAGHVLTGNRAFVVVHEVVGANVIGFVSIGQVVVVALLLRARLVRPWLLVLAVVALALVVAQVFLGFDGRMALHVPNGLLILVAQGVLLLGARGGEELAATP